MKKIALIVEYDGKHYKGFQSQPNAPTIQNTIENALSMLTKENIAISAAGRTDAGVHAKSQVISFNTMTQNSIQTYINGTNHFLPDDISIKNGCEVDMDFDPRRMAISRKYEYSIDCGSSRSPLTAKFAYYLGKALNVPIMVKGSKYFLGIHDFKNFSTIKRNESKSTIREIYDININKIEKMVYITVEGSAFLSHQVRRMCGALVAVGTEIIKPNIIKDLLENKIVDVTPQTLPAHGLCLVGVNYKYFNLDGDQNEE
ncbi:MAG: tRNA pseudouridine(38-40) synthase TruA [SAR202 cluster bacterium]|nr:tRNA pseudouridine(38-40) synthase TruA [Chloroflexota bacterium]MQG39572.1 tRNA pseudouridine(38-40) synthase TruA [SAR202 cluster bacterium]|tara:strand:+ start:146 stop:919 length:774 start_codon:yes stop_codon:yes gene_type:complete